MLPAVRAVRIALTTLALGAALAACGVGDDGMCDGATMCHHATTDSGHADGDSATHPQLPTDLLSLEILPANAVLTATNGSHPMQAYTTVGHQRDGHTRPVVGVRFSIADSSLGALDAMTGQFVSTGFGGTTHVQAATLDGTGLTATTTLTINASFVVLGPGVMMSDVTRIETGTISPMSALGPAMDYPLEGAVMPRNVFPPKLMWTSHQPAPAPTDIYRVALDRTHSAVRGYFLNDPSLHDAWQLAQDAWGSIANTDVGDPIVSRVSVLSGAMVYAGPTRSFKTVDGVIAGSVYYWSPSESALRRIDVEPATLVNFLPNPGSGCIGCHTVSRDGRRIEGFLESPNPGDPAESLAAFDLTADLTGSPAPRLFRVAYPDRRCSSFNDEATRLVAGGCGAEVPEQLTIIDMATGVEMPGVGAAMGMGIDPEWSPDDHSIAFTNGNNDLMVAPAGAGDTFSAPTMAHAAASTPGGSFDWHPSWTPDSAWMAFQHGNTRRTGVLVDGSAGAQGQIYMIPRAGGTPVRLDNLGGGPSETDSYRPIFSPFNSGGYFWVLFTSTRDYGNAAAGVHGSQQIWVAAINNHPTGTSDPSSVPYYLAGQEAGVIALSPYWAPPPCRANGNACSTGGECCTGTCAPDDAGNNVCRSGTTCHMRSATCDSNADCCGGLVCTVAHICDQPPPG